MMSIQRLTAAKSARLTVSLVVLLGAFLVMGESQAGTPPPPAFTVTPNPAPLGEPITIQSTADQPCTAAAVNITISDDASGAAVRDETVVPNSSGAWSTVITGLAAGSFHVEVDCTGVFIQTLAIQVIPPAPPPPTPQPAQVISSAPSFTG